MKVLVVGSGGREHALAWAVSKSNLLEKLYVTPGNVGTEALGENLSLDIHKIHEIASVVKKKEIDLVIIGPEAALLNGLSSVLGYHGIPVFGPSSASAVIEGSKAYAKNFMERFRIPTAGFAVFDNSAEAHHYIRQRARPLVVKADGIAAGKGVFVCQSEEEAHKAVENLMEKYTLGRAGQRVVIEDKLFGRELSLFAITDGEHAWLLPPARDHKSLNEGGKGPMTGGMGAFCPVPDVEWEQTQELFYQTLLPAIKGLAREARTFQGVLYAGLMLTEDGPRVLEFNCRFGDPEAQVLLPRARFDWLEVFWQVATKTLPEKPPANAWNNESTVGIVLAAEGYPVQVATGDTIEGLSSLPETQALVFHSATKREGSQILTSGGRVLTVVTRGATLEEARQKGYQAVEQINFRGKYFRSDIGV